MDKQELQSVRHIRNGGIEQGILEAVKETQGLSEKDEARLKELQSLPQDRTEILRTSKIKKNENQGWRANNIA